MRILIKRLNLNLIFLNFILLNVKANDHLIEDLIVKINSYQVLEVKNYSPPFSYAKKYGLFESEIRINIVGDSFVTKLRNSKLFGVYDNNMFVTAWIISTLTDSVAYGNLKSMDERRLVLGLDGIGDFNDKNSLNQGKFTFWEQEYNYKNNIWFCKPDNIQNLINTFEEKPLEELIKIFTKLHLKTFSRFISYLKNLLDIKIFQIPPDFDDSMINLGVGASLFKLKNDYPTAFSTWNKNSFNANNLIEAFVKYAYKPFDSNLNSNIIDPRTYFFARSFIQEALSKNQSLSLITTWIQNIDEQRVLYKEGVSMPFNVNNVDVTVCANSIYGITSATLFDINGFQKEFLNSLDFQQLYLNTTKFITWAIETNYTSRPDLALVYYPSVYNFLWYTSRTLFLLENELDNVLDVNLKKIFQEAKDYLTRAFEGTATDFLFKNVNYESSKETFFDDFLGLNDTNVFGKQTPSGEDRIFSTAQSINILIATWTYQNSTNKKLIWKNNVDQKVKDLVQTSINWLQQNVFNPKLKPSNAFFSGSVKSTLSEPFWYPSNFIQLLNGTFANRTNLREIQDIIFGVSGVIEEEKYAKMLKEKHFGKYTPLNFNGYNVRYSFFPYWSSEPYTFSVALLAITQFGNVLPT